MYGTLNDANLPGNDGVIYGQYGNVYPNGDAYIDNGVGYTFDPTFNRVGDGFAGFDGHPHGSEIGAGPSNGMVGVAMNALPTHLPEENIDQFGTEPDMGNVSDQASGLQPAAGDPEVNRTISQGAGVPADVQQGNFDFGGQFEYSDFPDPYDQTYSNFHILDGQNGYSNFVDTGLGSMSPNEQLTLATLNLPAAETQVSIHEILQRPRVDDSIANRAQQQQDHIPAGVAQTEGSPDTVPGGTVPEATVPQATVPDLTVPSEAPSTSQGPEEHIEHDDLFSGGED